jgi:GMC oxidoreductase
MATKICIIGCGTYGSYLIKGLMEKFGNDIELTVIEMGNEKTKNEEEIGVKAESGGAQAAEKGRYFGLGGTSARWGGQVLFFDERDNPTNDADWQTIIDINKKYRPVVLEKLLGTMPKIASLVADKGIEKTGIWLKYTKRNLFKSLDKTVLNPVRLIKNQRVTGFAIENNTIKGVSISDGGFRISEGLPPTSNITNPKYTEGVTETVNADIFYLTAGAIESCRLLLTLQEQHSVLTSTDLGKHYGDHLSVELFKIQGHKPVINGIDLLPTFINGSLITKRLIVSDDTHRIGFAHPIFNKEVKVFTSIKRLLFGKQQMDFNLKDVLDGFIFLIRFGFSVVFLKKMYAHRNNWSLQLEIEQAFPNTNTIDLSENLDKFGQKAVRLNWQVSAEDKQAIETIKTNLKTLLDNESIPYSVVYDPNVEATKIEDVYHPVGFIRMGHDDNAVLDPDCRVKGVNNLYNFSTAMFPSAKSINPTAAVFCFIEHHLAQLHDNFSTNHNVGEVLNLADVEK